MKRQVKIFWIGIFIVFIILLFAGCKVKKSDKSAYEIRAIQTEDTTTTMNSEKETGTQSGSKSETESNISEQEAQSSDETTESWRETNYYDKEGNLRRTVKEGSVNNKKKNSHSERQNNTQVSDSMYNNVNTKENIDSASVSSSLNNVDTRIDLAQNTQSDSRLIQGVDWFYLTGIFLLIVGIVVLLLKKKNIVRQ